MAGTINSRRRAQQDRVRHCIVEDLRLWRTSGVAARGFIMAVNSADQESCPLEKVSLNGRSSGVAEQLGLKAAAAVATLRPLGGIDAV